MSQMLATASFLNLQITPTRGLIRSEPVSIVSFRETPCHLAEQSKTTQLIWFSGVIDAMMRQVPLCLSLGCPRGRLCITFVNGSFHECFVLITLLFVGLSFFLETLQANRG